ncbi:hypothetical protein Syun_020824 [Stephania yunnanensis]|uniref:Uncharacterized protein n=1 Tax=Stephania yunnanensis TaxID=152371 RepID=A0AAP0IEX1_9MAGN
MAKMNIVMERQTSLNKPSKKRPEPGESNEKAMEGTRCVKPKINRVADQAKRRLVTTSEPVEDCYDLLLPGGALICRWGRYSDEDSEDDDSSKKDMSMNQTTNSQSTPVLDENAEVDGDTIYLDLDEVALKGVAVDLGGNDVAMRGESTKLGGNAEGTQKKVDDGKANEPVDEVSIGTEEHNPAKQPVL